MMIQVKYNVLSFMIKHLCQMNLRESLRCDIEHYPVKVDSGKCISCKICWWYTGVKVNSGVCRCDSCKVSICLPYFNIDHICTDIVVIKKKVYREYPKSVGKDNNKGSKKYQT